MSHNGGGKIIRGEDPVALQRFDEMQAEAFLRMASDLPKYPNSRWNQLRHTNFPNRMGGRMCLNYLDAGGDPRRLEIIGDVWHQWARSFRSESITPERLRLISCHEEEKNFKVQRHQVSLTGNESVEQLTVMEFDIGEQITALHDLNRAVALAKRQKVADERQLAQSRFAARQRVSA